MTQNLDEPIVVTVQKPPYSVPVLNVTSTWEAMSHQTNLMPGIQVSALEKQVQL